MADLAFKESNYDTMYPSSVDGKQKKPPKRYPSVTLPISMLDGKAIDLDDDIEVRLKGKISRVEKSKYSEDFTIELKTGNVETKDKTLTG